MNAGTDRKPIAVLIDADNISAQSAGAIFKKACSFGEPIARRAYGMVNCFAADGGWSRAQREYGIVARPQISNIAGKNVADIALVIDAMEFLYKSPCAGICIVSSDSDYTALAAKIREGGKSVYGMGGEKTPTSFRTACTAFFEIPAAKKTETSKKQDGAKGPAGSASTCPRCGGKLASGWTKSNVSCRICASCGGMTSKLQSLKKAVSADSLNEILERARRQEQIGCVCPDCGASMSIVRVSSGNRHVEIDVCGKCRAIWYDKDEFNALVPNDGVLVPTVSAGKAYRREMVVAIAADLRSGRIKASSDKALQSVLKSSYHVPQPDVGPIVSTLMCQRVIAKDKKTGRITLV